MRHPEEELIPDPRFFRESYQKKRGFDYMKWITVLMVIQTLISLTHLIVYLVITWNAK